MPADKRQDDKEDDGDDSKPLTLEAVMAAVDAKMNGAVKAQLKKALTSTEFRDVLSAAVKGAVKPVDADDADGDEEAVDGDAPPAAAKVKKASSSLPVEVQAAINEAHRKVRELKEENRKERKAREERDSMSERDEERRVLTEALAAGGVQKDMLKPALSFLIHEEKRIKRLSADQGKALRFVHDEEEHEVEEGVKRWLESDRRFLPPKAGGGSGVTGNGGGDRRPGAGGQAAQVSDSELGQMLFKLG